MVRHGWLRQSDRLDQFAHAGLLVRTGRDDRQQSETGGISQSLQRLGKLLRVRLGERLTNQRRTARYGGDVPNLERGDHASMLVDIDSGR